MKNLKIFILTVTSMFMLFTSHSIVVNATDKHIILIAGINATGKTTYGELISKKANLPFISKDKIKSTIFDVVHYDTSSREMPRLYGIVSTELLFHFAECLMKTGTSFILESNFLPSTTDKINELLEKYNYKALTVLFDADMSILMDRFWKRNSSGERMAGLTYGDMSVEQKELLKKEILPCREFGVGIKLVIDTSDFAKVNYEEIDAAVIKFLYE